MSPPDRDQVTGVILAGGKSLRMGGSNKALILHKGKPLFGYALSNLEVCCARVVVNTERDQRTFEDMGLEVVGDGQFAGHGPVAGIHAALAFASTPFVAIAACDQLDLPAEVYQTLCSEVTETGAVYASSANDAIPTCAVLPVNLVEAARNALQLEQRALMAFMTSIGRPVAFDHIEFANLNHRHQVSSR